MERLHHDHAAPARDGSDGLASRPSRTQLSYSPHVRASAWLPSLFLGLWPTLAVVLLARPSLDIALAAVAVYACGVALVSAQNVLAELGHGPDVAARGAGTLSDAALVDRAWQRFRRRSIFLAAPFAAAAWLAMPSPSGLGRVSLALVAVAGGWSVVLAGTAAVLAFVALRPFTGLGPPLNVLVVATAFSPVLPATLPASAWLAISLTPGGWAAQLLRQGVHGNEAGAWLWLVPIVVFASLTRMFVSRLRASYRVAEVVFVSGVGYVARLESD